MQLVTVKEFRRSRERHIYMIYDSVYSRTYTTEERGASVLIPLFVCPNGANSDRFGGVAAAYDCIPRMLICLLATRSMYGPTLRGCLFLLPQ